MSLEKAKANLDKKGFLDHVIELADSTATVAEAAEALGVEPRMIAKTMIREIRMAIMVRSIST